ncbi:S1/P1 nuclease [Shewanella sp. 202IG2-18]|uniref:S1/P1 nuclease n=1 Tax=Parashewanella hymeniacidonis TaxID=2807618 RepID=UPI001960AEEF|nr:S1/P1 nuclease [Parashewanella hymeniacidonis]MBM7070530.1 S1/P1 nuclease [Parashewanella hymeniacidonis]
MKKVLILLFTVLFSSQSFAFGHTGHRIVAQIAQQLLTQEAKQAILKITEGYPLAKLATFPDDVRPSPAWKHTLIWHYINAKYASNIYQQKASGEPANVIQALPYFEKKLLHRKELTAEQRWQALAFYVHLVGDIHQPLHAGYASDHGGNSIKVDFLGHPSDLHAVWDSGMINAQNLSYEEYATFLKPTNQEITQWSISSYVDWAKESVACRNIVYGNLPPKKNGVYDLSYTYMYQAMPTLNRRLQQAGVRLAEKLNKIFG